MTPIETASAFVAAVNAGDVETLTSLMTPDHRFVDADGSEHVGRDTMQAAWRGYLDMVPDFRIDVSDRCETTDFVVLLGRASGTVVQDGVLRPENHWSVPAAWRVVVDSDLVAVWQLHADQHPLHRILDRIRSTR